MNMNLQLLEDGPTISQIQRTVLASRGLKGLSELLDKYKIEGGIDWNQETEMFTVAIPFRPSQKKLADNCLALARKNKLSAQIDTVKSETNEEIDALLIGTEMRPAKGIYSPHEMSVGLDNENPLVSTLIAAYNYIHEDMDLNCVNGELRASLLSGARIEECLNSPDLITISNSKTALLYITSEGRASLSIPDVLVKPAEHNALEDLVKTLAKDLGAEVMAVKNGAQHVRIVQLELSAYEKLKAFAKSEFMIFS